MGKKVVLPPPTSRFFRIFSSLVTLSSLTYILIAYHTLLLEAHIKPSITVIYGFALHPLLVPELKPVGIICILESL